jgi:phosphopantetheinyl transferase
MSSDEQGRRGPTSALAVWLATQTSSRFDPAVLTPDEHLRYRRLRSSRKRKEFELSRALLHSLGPSTGIRSVSHSGGYAAVATSRARALGIDIESHRPRDVISLAQFAFHPDEATALAKHPKALECFYSLWVLKEACAKALRLELLDALRTCVFTIEDEISAGALPTRQPWQAYVWRVRPEMSLGVVVLGAKQPLQVEQLEWPQASAGAWLQTVSLAGGVATAL